MAALGTPIAYAPTTAVTINTTAATALAAVDTTNVRLSNVIAPRNGCIWWEARGCIHGATSAPQILIGVLEGASVVARSAPFPNNMGASATNRYAWQAQGYITGLTPWSSHTYDLAIGTETAVASTGVKYGGPNNTTSNDAFGAICFSMWETDNLLSLAAGGVAAKAYDPASVGSASSATLQVMTASDTTNLRFTNVILPPSGKAYCDIRVVAEGASTFPSILLGLLEGATVIGPASCLGGKYDMGALAATTICTWEVKIPISGTPGTQHTYDLAMGVESAQASSVIAWGGPNDTTASNAWGGANIGFWAC